MRTYRITNRITQEAHCVPAEAAGSACRSLGWMVGDCYVEDLTEARAKALEEVAWASPELAQAIRADDLEPGELGRLRASLEHAARQALRLGCTADKVNRAQVRVAEEAA